MSWIGYCTRRPCTAARRVPRIAAVLLLLAALSPALADDRLQRSEAELEQVRSRIAQLTAALDATRGARDELRRSLEDAERRIGSALATLRQLSEQIRQQEARIAQTRARRDAAAADLARQRQALARQIRTAYVIGQQARTKLLLNQEDPALLSRVLTYFDYYNRARSRRIAEISERVAELERIEQQLSEQLARLDALRTAQRRHLDELEAGRAQRAIAMERIEAQLRDQGRRLKELESSERQLTRLIESLREVLADIPPDLGGEPFATLRGRLPWPARGTILARYGAPKAGGRLRWRGLWIATEAGAPVRAVAMGRVAWVGWMNRYGLLAVVEHDGGYYTLYGHNRQVFKSVGEWVAAGEVLAEAGDTGGQSRPGVYFEIRQGARPVDPARWLGG